MERMVEGAKAASSKCVINSVTVNGAAGRNCLPRPLQKHANLCQCCLYRACEADESTRKDKDTDRLTKEAMRCRSPQEAAAEWA